MSSSVGNPSSLDDYYRRRNRYLITRAGQEVYDLTERVLTGIDEIADVQAGRLRDLHGALSELGRPWRYVGFDYRGQPRYSPTGCGAVFDVHERFTTELTQFFAELNLWQSRYDLERRRGPTVCRAFSSPTFPNNSGRSNAWCVPSPRSLERILPRLAVPDSRPCRTVWPDRVGDAGLAGIR